MAKREYLMLAHKYQPKIDICGWYCSEKLDGIRAFWDGGISRGLPCREVPYANVTKHDRYLNEQKATGLWTRYGQAIQAPDWFLDKLPASMMDGELWAGYGKFERTMSITRDLVPDNDKWSEIQYMVFELPSMQAIFEDGEINNLNFKKTFKDIKVWMLSRPGVNWNQDWPFYKVQHQIKEIYKDQKHPDIWRPVIQKIVPSSSREAESWLQEQLKTVLDMGGEGLMLRCPSSHWHPERSHDLLKLKPYNDIDATVIGYKWGKPTDIDRCISGEATNRMLGKMGSLIVRLDNGITFDLGSGLKDNQREMIYGTGEGRHRRMAVAGMEGTMHPGEIVNTGFVNEEFPLGCRITLKYRELTAQGVPKEARFWRKL